MYSWLGLQLRYLYSVDNSHALMQLQISYLDCLPACLVCLSAVFYVRLQIFLNQNFRFRPLKEGPLSWRGTLCTFRHIGYQMEKSKSHPCIFQSANESKREPPTATQPMPMPMPQPAASQREERGGPNEPFVDLWRHGGHGGHGGMEGWRHRGHGGKDISDRLASTHCIGSHVPISSSHA
jgi:hypothetical protein